MKIVTYYRVVTGVGFLSALIVGAITTWMFLLSGRPAFWGICAFIPVFCIVLLTVACTLWRRGPMLPLDTSTFLMMDPRGFVLLPKNYGPPKCRALKIVLYYAPRECPALQDLIDWAVENCKKHSRFRKTPRFNFDEPLNSSFGDPELKTKEDVARHIVDWPAVDTEYDLTEALRKIDTLKLVENAPAWIIYRIPSSGAARSSTVLKVSHCIADGLRLAIWAESIMTDSNGAPCDWGLGPIKGEASSRWNAKRKPVRINFLSMLKMNFESVTRSLAATSHTDTLTPFNPKSELFKGKTVTYRMKPIPLETLKRIAVITSSTINDVLTAVTASAIRKYCLEIDPSFRNVKKPMCRGVLAFGFPCQKGFMRSSEQLFNNFTVVPIVFPIGIMTCRQRLITAKKTLFQIKNTITAPVIAWSIRILTKLGLHNVTKKWLTDASTNISCAFSNVRGPPNKAFFLGKEIVHLECSFPQYSSMFIFVSYCGMMGCTLTTDGSALKKPQLLLDNIHTEVMRFKDELVPTDLRTSVVSMDVWQ